MPFLYEVTVQPGDIDRLGHASNQVYLRWVLEAALAADRLQVQTRVESMSVASSVRKTAIFRGDVLLMSASTDWVYVALPSGRPVRIPP